MSASFLLLRVYVINIIITTMDTFDGTKSAISNSDLVSGVDFIEEFSNELSNYPNRLVGTENEIATARAIRNRLHDESNVKTRLEAFKAYPLLGRGAFPLIGFWFMLSLLLYCVSFLGGKVGGILLTLLSLIVFLSGVTILTLLFLGNTKYQGILNHKVSYNVVSEFDKPYSKEEDKEKKKKIFIIVDNHDALLGSPINNFDKFRKVTMIIAPITIVIFVIFCIIKMAIGVDTIAKEVPLILIPVITSVLGIFVFLTHFSLSPHRARQNNGISTSVAMATYSYFVEQPDIINEGVKLVYASLGGENSGHCGSEAFVKSHPEFQDAYVICVGDIQSGNIKIAEKDALRNIGFSMQLVAMVKSSAHEQGIEIESVKSESLSSKFNSLHGYTSNAFSKKGIASTTIVAKSYQEESRVLERHDIEKLFSTTVGTLKKLMAEDFITDDEDEVIEKVQSAEIEIVDVQGK